MRIISVFRFLIISGLVYFSPIHIGLSGAQESRDALHGSILAEYCRGHTDIDVGICTGYILAVAEAMLSGREAYGHRACGHDGVRAQQLVDLVRLDLGRNRDLTAQPAGTMVAQILAGSYQCSDLSDSAY